LHRIARQVAVMYEDVERTPLPDALRRALGKPWAAHIGVKVAFFP